MMLKKEKRERLTYMLNVGHLEGFSRLGSDDPLLDVARDLKGIREDLRRVVSGRNRLQVDTYTSEDRETENSRYREFLEDARNSAKEDEAAN